MSESSQVNWSCHGLLASGGVRGGGLISLLDAYFLSLRLPFDALWDPKYFYAKLASGLSSATQKKVVCTCMRVIWELRC